jgi:hypothetical protein
MRTRDALKTLGVSLTRTQEVVVDLRGLYLETNTIMNQFKTELEDVLCQGDYVTLLIVRKKVEKPVKKAKKVRAKK